MTNRTPHKTVLPCSRWTYLTKSLTVHKCSDDTLRKLSGVHSTAITAILENSTIQTLFRSKCSCKAHAKFQHAQHEPSHVWNSSERNRLKSAPESKAKSSPFTQALRMSEINTQNCFLHHIKDQGPFFLLESIYQGRRTTFTSWICMQIKEYVKYQQLRSLHDFYGERPIINCAVR